MLDKKRAAQVLDRDVRTTYHESTDGGFTLRTYQDVEPVMDACAAARRADAEHRGRFGKRPDLHRVMSVPENVIYEIAQRLGIPRGKVLQTEYSRRIFEELKRPEFKCFRTTTDRLIGK